MALEHATTWEKRNYRKLERVYQEAQGRRMRRPRILDIGPGGIVAFLSWLYPTGEETQWSRAERAKKGFSWFEKLFRKSGALILETYEPLEILDLFADLDPRLLVIDKEREILGSAYISCSQQNGHVRTRHYDITAEPIQETGDIVISYGTVQSDNQEYALQNIVTSVRGNGLLSYSCGDDTLSPEEFGMKKLDDFLYVKE